MSGKRRSHSKKRPENKNRKKRILIDISTLGYRGEGVYRDNAVTIHVRKALPGERVSCEIGTAREKVKEGRIRELVTRSPLRVDPGCEAYERGCGGCQLLHLEYGSQCEWKTTMVRETLARAGIRRESVHGIIKVEAKDRGRNKLTLARDSRGALGMCPEQSTEVLQVAECRQEAAVNMEIQATLKGIRVPESVTQIHLRAQADGRAGMHFFSKTASKGFYRLAAAIMREEPRIVGIGVRTYRGYEHLDGEEYTIHNEHGFSYRIPHQGFFQTNYEQAGRLLGLVLDYAEPKRTDKVCDLYSGCGFFSLPVARKAGLVTGIESSDTSVKAATENAVTNRVGNARFVRDDAARRLRFFKPGDFDTLIIDPPRMGCDENVLREILRVQPGKIVYVSCSPKTLADDLSILRKSGYSVTHCQPVDMFPNTYHAEIVARLVLR